MKKSGVALLIIGLLGIGAGFGYPLTFGAAERCEREMQAAIDLASQAVAAGENTERGQALMAKLEQEQVFARDSCDRAAAIRQDGYLISGGGLLLAIVGFVLKQRSKG